MSNLIEFYTEPYLVTGPDGTETWLERELYKVILPGDRNTQFVGRVTPEVIREHRREYENFKAGLKATSEGYPLKMWAPISAPFAAHLAKRDITTVEQLAAVSDANVQGLGMGMGKYRDLAVKWLEEKERNAPVDAVMKENIDLRETIRVLTLKVENLASQRTTQPVQIADVNIVPSTRKMDEIDANGGQQEKEDKSFEEEPI